MPVSVAEWLPEDHLAWFILNVVDQLDLAELYGAYRRDGWGRAAYEPSMMLALLLYANCVGERSSRRIEWRCREDVAFRVITANTAPDHATIARFRERHEQVLQGLFVQSLRLCRAAGLVQVGVVAVDGTKIRAQASMNATRSRAQIQTEVAAMFTQARAADTAEDLAADEGSAQSPPPMRGGRAARRVRLLAAKANLEHEDRAAEQAYQQVLAQRAAREAATGKRLRGRKPRPPVADPTRRVNTSDPESRLMPVKGGWLQGYNAQIVTTADQIIVAATVSTTTNDQPLLHPMLTAATTTLAAAGINQPIGVLLADAGYCTEDNLAAADPAGPRLLMPTYNMRKDRDVDDAHRQVGNRAPKKLSAKARMEQGAGHRGRTRPLPAAQPDRRGALPADQRSTWLQALPAPRQASSHQRVEPDLRHPQPAQTLAPHPPATPPDGQPAARGRLSLDQGSARYQHPRPTGDHAGFARHAPGR